MKQSKDESLAGEITQLLGEIRGGSREAMDTLFERVYHELREMAGRKFRGERKGHTLQPTALVHEVWMRLFKRGSFHAPNRAYFFAAAAKAMRRILVEHARKRTRRIATEETLAQTSGDMILDELESTHRVRFLDLDKALEQLKQMNKRQHEVTTMRFFGCLKWQEISELLDIAVSTAEKDWQAARAWLHVQLKGEGHDA